MKVLIGGVDYSASLLAAPPLAIKRVLNKPSTCSFSLGPLSGVMTAPVRDAFVEVQADNGVTLFTGYVFSDPASVYAGEGITGSVYETRVSAISEEYVLDRQAMPVVNGGVNLGAGEMLGAITSRLNAEGLSTAGLNGGPNVGRYAPRDGARWSEHAGELSLMSRQAYRALSGSITMEPVGTTTHALDAGSVTLSGVVLESNKPIANDVTLSGTEEGDCYVVEVFQGDGVTKDFVLSRSPWKPAKGKLLQDAFTASQIQTQLWTVDDPGSHFGLGATGLTFSGGNGSDGQTTLSAIDPVELGGEIVFEAGNVQLSAGSGGQILGVYAGQVQLANCVAGFNVRSSSGALLLAPVVDGSEAATPFTLTPNHDYTLRIRLYAPEVVRALATYYSTTAKGTMARGGGLVSSPAWISFELQDSAAAADTPATVLCDGTVSVLPAAGTFCAVDSIALQGSVGYFTVERTGTVRVSSIPPGAAERTRRIGTAAQGAECHISGETVEFYTAATPANGELVKVRYRTMRRSVARLADGAVADGNVPAVSSFAGSVEKPPARCSADCEAAVQATLDASANPLAGWQGTVEAVNLQNLSSGDVWPGDVVTLATPLVNGAQTSQPNAFVARAVTVSDACGLPEELRYRVEMANEWSEALSVRVKETIAQDALLPANPAPGVGDVAISLPQADVSSISTTAVTFAMNATAPSGGGFEVRRQDSGWGDGVAPGLSSQGLVLQSPVATFTIPRAADHEEFYVRAYDGSTPPRYSRSSAAAITNVPTQ